jgi:lambda family phage portal protein
MVLMGAETKPGLVAADGHTPLRASYYGTGDGTPYRGADRLSQELAQWSPMLQSPDAAIYGQRDDLVARGRDLVRNNGFAAGAQQTLLDNIVGAQWTLICQPNWQALGLGDMKDEERDAFEESVEAAFDEWAYGIGNWCDASRRSNFTGLLRQAFVSWFDCGEFLSVSHWLGDRVGPGLAQYATAMQIVSPDRLSNPQNAPDTFAQRGGIELGEHGEPLAYWIRKAHPYDPWSGAQYFEWERFERELEFGRPQVLHGFLVDGDGHSRGVSPLASIIESFKLLDVYDRSEVKAAILNAVFAAVIETQSGLDGGMVDELFGFGPAVDATGKPIPAIPGPPMMMADGTRIPKLPVGTKLNFQTAERPAAQYADFSNAVTRRLAAGAGMATEEFSHDYSQTNYSSGRASLLQSWKAVTGRAAFFRSTFATPIYALFFEEAVDSGRIVLPTSRKGCGFYEKRAAWLGCDWLGPGQGQIDPVKERQAYQIGFETFTDTLQTANAEQGRNWRVMVRQASREDRYLERFNVRRGDTAAMMGAKAPSDNEQPKAPPQ